MCGFFDESFFQQLVTTFVGVAAGIPAALLIGRLANRGQQKETTRQLRSAIREALEKNRTLLTQLAGELAQPGFLPTYFMDLQLLDATAYRKYEVFRRPQSSIRIDQARYELTHLNSKLGFMRDVFPGHITTAGSGNALRQLTASCVAHLPIVQNAVQEALDAIAAE